MKSPVAERLWSGLGVIIIGISWKSGAVATRCYGYRPRRQITRALAAPHAQAKQQKSKGIRQGCVSAAATGAAVALFRFGSFQNFFARSNREWALRARSSNPSIWAC